jgi:hypothetical protein
VAPHQQAGKFPVVKFLKQKRQREEKYHLQVLHQRLKQEHKYNHVMPAHAYNSFSKH